jgi:hypothetical protein
MRAGCAKRPGALFANCRHLCVTCRYGDHKDQHETRSADPPRHHLLPFGYYLLSFFFIYLPWRTQSRRKHHGARVERHEADELASFLEEHDLRYEVQDSDYVSNMPPLSVKDQYPKAGSG